MAPSRRTGFSWKSCLSLISTALLSTSVSAIDVDVNSTDSLLAAAKAIVPNMVAYYHGTQYGQTPGVMPQPYYWWEGAEFFTCLIDYWYYTGDTTYNNITVQGMQFQVGEFQNFEPTNQSFDLGNDDQVFWAFASMQAAEYGFQNPADDQPSWLSLAQAVFNRQTARWDPDTCNGGLRWQVFIANKGYDYKNTITNGGLFQLAARLGAYTKNNTYFDWANKQYDWLDATGLISSDYHVFDGVHTYDCTNITAFQWSYNLGTMLYGSAVMWNATQEDKWRDRTAGFLNASNVFFYNTAWGKVMQETECEVVENLCTQDMQSYKNDLSRWLGMTTQVASWTTDTIVPLLQTSAIGAAKACTGPGNACGLRWYQGNYDGLTGLGEEMDALAVMVANIVHTKHGPLTSKTGGNSTSNAGAGILPTMATPKLFHITTASKAGASILTIIFLGTTLGVAVWMVI